MTRTAHRIRHTAPARVRGEHLAAANDARWAAVDARRDIERLTRLEAGVTTACALALVAMAALAWAR